MKTVFITGAAGFIGGHIAEKFIQQNWHVIALLHKRKSEKLDLLARSNGLEFVNGDIRKFESLRTALLAGNRKIDAIVHCAGRASDVGWHKEFRRTNLESVKHLVKLTKDQNVGRFVFVSTTDVYGLRDFNGETEDELLIEPYPKNPYPKYKILAEQHIGNELPKDLFSILRPAQVWGIGDTTLTPRIVDFLKWSPCIMHFGKWHGKNRWPLAHVKNVAIAIYLATTLPEASGKAINVVDSECTSIDDFYRILARIYLPHKKFKTVTLPFCIGRIIGSVVSCISNLLDLRQPFMDPSMYALYSVSRNLDFSNKRFLTLLAKAGQQITTLEEGVHELEKETK